MENGYSLSEPVIVTRVSEGEITFKEGVQYVAVMQGTAAGQVKQATAGATTVLGFAKKPSETDIIVTKRAVDVVLAPAVIAMGLSGAVNVNDYLEVGSTVTELSKLTVDSSDNVTVFASVVARAIQKTTDHTIAWVSVGRA